MDKILDRLGIYDLFAVFIPGFIGCISLLISIKFCHVDFKFSDNSIFLLIGSYLLGICLHEIGHIISKYIVYRNNSEPLYTYLELDSRIFSMYEKNLYTKILKSIMGIKGDIKREYARYFFRYCYEFIYVHQKASKADMFSSLYSMSRSLYCFYFGLMAAVPVFYVVLKKHNINMVVPHLIVIAVISGILGIISFCRAYRFNECRVKVILRTFISIQVKKNNNLRISRYALREQEVGEHNSTGILK